MKLEALANTVESNIVHLFKKFKEKPAVFLSKADVTCYLYYLLITDPFLGYSPTIKNLAPTIAKSKTFLIHAGLEVSIENQNKQVAISIGESEKEIELSKWDFLVGIEIEHNTKPTKNIQNTIAENIEKVSKYKKGYILWLNWETSIDDENLREIQELISKRENVKLFYLDLVSIPVKTNIKKIA
jgi:hypothetical protein